MQPNMDRINIGHFLMGPDQRCFVIAEGGVNHNGDVGAALCLVDAADEAGADAIKFQTFRTPKLVSRDAAKAGYQCRATGADESQAAMLQRLELTDDEHRQIFAYSQRRGIMFLSTPFDMDSASFLMELGVEAFKIGSGDLTNLPLLRRAGQFGRPVIVSTGMAHLHEVEQAVATLHDAGCRQLILMQCVSNYPAEPADANLQAMRTMRDAFGVPVGYSDHTLGHDVAVAAVAMGACVLEKHLTLDRDLPGPDHQCSLTPDQFKAMVEAVRRVESAMGDGVKQPAHAEHEMRHTVRRSLAAAVDIAEGAVITEAMIAILRPGDGIEPASIDQIIGRKARRAINAGTRLGWSDVA